MDTDTSAASSACRLEPLPELPLGLDHQKCPLCATGHSGTYACAIGRRWVAIYQTRD